jgi:hypothetical protein
MVTNHSIIDLAGSQFLEELEDLSDQQTYKEALKSDPVSLGHNIINVLHASGQRHDQFEDYIQEGNKEGYWGPEDENGVPIDTGKKVEICVLQLLCDVKTQWDSVYYTIHCLCYLQQVRVTM